MKRKRVVFVVSVLLAGVLLMKIPTLSAETAQNRVVRIAELVIDPVQIDDYKVALREEIATSIRVEPGVLTLYAVSVKNQPNHVRLFEIYANPSAYEAHLKSSHFIKYKRDTSSMVKSLTLLETEPILLGTK